MSEGEKRGRNMRAGDFGLEGVTRTLKRIEVMPKGGFKTAKERSVSITLPRVKFLEVEVSATPTAKKSRGGRPRKRPAT